MHQVSATRQDGKLVMACARCGSSIDYPEGVRMAWVEQFNDFLQAHLSH